MSIIARFLFTLFVIFPVMPVCSIKALGQTENVSVDIQQIKQRLKQLDEKFRLLEAEKEDLSDKLESLENQEQKEESTEAPASDNTDSSNNTDEKGKKEVESNVTSASLDLAVPESPAFAVLGLSPQEVIRPTTPRELATELLNGIDRNGNFQSGVAVDLVPFLLFAGEKTSLQDYRDNTMTYLLTNTQLSFATAKGSSDDDKSIKVATGLKIVPWNRGDPRTFKRTKEDIEAKGGNKEYWLEDCFEKSLKTANIEDLELEIAKLESIDLLDPERQKCVAELKKKCEELPENERLQCALDVDPKCNEQAKGRNEEQIEKLKLQIEERLLVKAEECRNDLRKLTWNRSALTFGVAPTWISTTGEVGDIDWNGLGAWASLAYGFEGVPKLKDTSQFIIHGRYRTDEDVPIEGMEGQFLTQDSLFLGARLIVGSPTLAAQFEGGYTYSDPDNGDNENSFLLSAGGSIKIRDDLWLELAIGGKSSDANSDSEMFVLNSLKWGFQSKPTIK